MGFVRSPYTILALIGLAVLVGVVGARFLERTTMLSVAPLDVKDTLFALSRQDDEVLRISPNGDVIASAALPKRPAKLALVSGTHGRQPARVIVASTSSSHLSSFDARALRDATHRTLDIKANLLSPSPDGRHIAVGDTQNGVVVLLNAATLKEVARQTDLEGAHDLRFGPDGEHLYVSTLGKARLVALAGDDLTPIQEIAVDGLPYGIDHTVRTPDGRLGLVVSPVVAGVLPVSLGDELGTLQPIALPSPPSRGFLGPLGNTAWLPSGTEAALFRLDLKAISPKRTGNTSEPGTTLAALAAPDQLTDAEPSLPLGSAAKTPPLVQTARLQALPRTLSPEPFASTVLVATTEGLERIGSDGRVLEWIKTDNPVTRVLPIEAIAGSLLVHADGGLSRQSAHSPLDPKTLDAPSIFQASTAGALAFCHS